MKHIKSFSILLLIFSVALITIQCQHDNEDIIPVKGPDPVEHGDVIIDCPDCSGTKVAGEWRFDKAHSNVRWETLYKSLGSVLNGRFNSFVLEDLHFDEADPQNISFSGYVLLNSVNTGEPGRDGGCLLSTFGTEAAKTTEPENLAKLVSRPSTGRYSSIDEGFLIDADLTFLGVTKEVTVKFFYYPETDITTDFMCGISAEFEFNALTDFGLSSTNIADKVTVKINTLLKNKKS